MRPSGLFSVRVALAWLPLLAFVSAAFAQQQLTRQGDVWVRTFYGAGAGASRLRVKAAGPVTLAGGVSGNLSYQVKVSVKARTAAEAVRIFERYAVRLVRQGDWLVLTAPGGAFASAVSVKAPRLAEAAVSTSDGAVDVRGVDGGLPSHGPTSSRTCSVPKSSVINHLPLPSVIGPLPASAAMAGGASNFCEMQISPS